MTNHSHVGFLTRDVLVRPSLEFPAALMRWRVDGRHGNRNTQMAPCRANRNRIWATWPVTPVYAGTCRDWRVACRCTDTPCNKCLSARRLYPGPLRFYSSTQSTSLMWSSRAAAGEEADVLRWKSRCGATHRCRTLRMGAAQAWSSGNNAN